MPNQDYKVDHFRQAMRRLAATVCVVSCKRHSLRYGITVTSVTPLSFSPLSILVCVNRNTTASNPLKDEGRYCINILRAHHSDVSTSFSGGLLQEERFNTGRWAEIEDVPYLLDAQASLFCVVDQIVPYATHDIIIGRVTEVRFEPDISPLVYQNGTYAVTAPLNFAVAV